MIDPQGQGAAAPPASKPKDEEAEIQDAVQRAMAFVDPGGSQPFGDLSDAGQAARAVPVATAGAVKVQARPLVRISDFLPWRAPMHGALEGARNVANLGTQIVASGVRKLGGEWSPDLITEDDLQSTFGARDLGRPPESWAGTLLSLGFQAGPASKLANAAANAIPGVARLAGKANLAKRLIVTEPAAQMAAFDPRHSLLQSLAKTTDPELQSLFSSIVVSKGGDSELLQRLRTYPESALGGAAVHTVFSSLAWLGKSLARGVNLSSLGNVERQGPPLQDFLDAQAANQAKSHAEGQIDLDFAKQAEATRAKFDLGVTQETPPTTGSVPRGTSAPPAAEAPGATPKPGAAPEPEIATEAAADAATAAPAAPRSAADLAEAVLTSKRASDQALKADMEKVGGSVRETLDLLADPKTDRATALADFVKGSRSNFDTVSGSKDTLDRLNLLERLSYAVERPGVGTATPNVPWAAQDLQDAASLARQMAMNDPNDYVKVIVGTVPQAQRTIRAYIKATKADLEQRALWLRDKIDEALSGSDDYQKLLADAGLDSRAFTMLDFRRSKGEVGRTLQSFQQSAGTKMNAEMKRALRETLDTQEAMRLAREQAVAWPNPDSIKGDPVAVAEEIARRGGIKAIEARLRTFQNELTNQAAIEAEATLTPEAFAQLLSERTAELARAIKPTSAIGMVNSFRVMGFLSWPLTPIKVAVNQGIFAGQRFIEGNVGAAIGAANAMSDAELAAFRVVQRSGVGAIRELVNGENWLFAARNARRAFAGGEAQFTGASKIGNEMAAARGTKGTQAFEDLTRENFENVSDRYLRPLGIPRNNPITVGLSYLADTTESGKGLRLAALGEKVSRRPLLSVDEFERSMAGIVMAKSRIKAVARAANPAITDAELETLAADKIKSVVGGDQLLTSNRVYENFTKEALANGAQTPLQVHRYAKAKASEWWADPANRETTSLVEWIEKNTNEIAGTTPLDESATGRLVGAFIRGSNRYPVTRMAAYFANTSFSIAKSVSQSMDAPGFAMALAAKRWPGVAGALANTNRRYVRELMSDDPFLRSQAIGRASGALVATLSLMDLASQTAPDGYPMVTGSGPNDKALIASMRRNRWRPYSIYVPLLGKRVGLGELDPMSAQAGVVSDLADLLRHADTADDPDVQSAALAVVMATSNMMINRTWMQTTSDLHGVMKGDEPAFERMVASYIQIVPKGITTAGNALSDELHIGDPAMKEAHGIINKLKAQLPLLRDNAPTLRDDYFEPIDKARHGVLAYLNPFTVMDVKTDAVSRELASLGAVFNKPPRKRYGLDMFDLKNAEGVSAYERYGQIAQELRMNGKSARESANDLIESAFYQGIQTKNRNGTPNLEGVALRENQLRLNRSSYVDMATLALEREFPVIWQARLDEAQRKGQVFTPR